MKRLTTGAFVAIGLAVACALALLIAPHASSSPDGLEKVAADEGIDRAALPHAVADGPLADYSVAGVDDEGLSTGVAGVIGIVAVFAITTGGMLVARRAATRRRTGAA